MNLRQLARQVTAGYRKKVPKSTDIFSVQGY